MICRDGVKGIMIMELVNCARKHSKMWICIYIATCVAIQEILNTCTR